MRDPEHSRNEAIYWEHEGNRAIRKDNWKLVSYYNETHEAMGVVGTGKRTGHWELYDIAKDRTELQDLTSRYPERVSHLLCAYQQWADRLNIRAWEMLLHLGGFDK
jgi:arylsulfatase